MGATNFVHTVEATDPEEAFDNLSQRDRFEYGNNPYNGTISTTRWSGHVKRVATTYSDKAAEDALEYIRKEDYGVKWYTRAVDAGVCGYEISQLVKTPHMKADAQYQTRYVVCEDGRDVSVHKTQADAHKALDMLIKHSNAEVVRVEKRSVKVAGKTSVTREYIRKSRVTKTRPKKVREGARVRELHVYYLYGWASC